MLSAAIKEVEVQDQKQNMVKPTLQKNDNVAVIKLALEQKVQFIQQSFEDAWKKYPLENSISQAGYLISHEGAVGSGETQIQSLLEKFQNYQNVEQIQADFSKLRAFWVDQCKTKQVLINFGDSYLISLHMMEALFICAHKDNLSYVIKSTELKEPVLSEETETKINLENVVQQVKNAYVKDLRTQLFVDNSKLSDEMLSEVVEVNRNIDLYHDKIKAVLEVKSVDLEEKVDDSAESKIAQLLSDELAYASLSLSEEIPRLKHTQEELIATRTALFDKHNKKIDETLTNVRTKVVPVQVNCDVISELSPLTKELHQVEASIETIEQQNKLKSLESDAALHLKEVVAVNKELDDGASLRDYALTFSKPRLIGRDKEPIRAMRVMYEKVLNEYLGGSPHIQKLDDLSFFEPMDITQWKEKKTSIEAKLEKITTQAVAQVRIDIQNVEFLKLRGAIITQEGEDLRHQASSYKDINPFPENFLALRRAALDEQWDALLVSEENIKKLEALPKKIFAAAERCPNHKHDIYVETAMQFNRNLAKFRTPVKKDVEVKGMPPCSQYKAPVPVSFIGSIQYADEVKPKRHWYSRFIDKPWKRALLIGLAAFLLAGAAATGVGLILEASLTTILAVSIGGGTCAGLLASGVTYACTPRRHQPPPRIAHIEPEEDKEQLMARRRAAVLFTASAPSVMPVHAPNSLHDDDSISCFDWFLCRRKSNNVDSPKQENSYHLSVDKKANN